MDRVYQANAIETPPSTTASSGSYPTAGNKAYGQLATVPGAYWFYSVTEEIRNALIAAGVNPDPAKVNQLAEAMGKLLPRAGGEMLGNVRFNLDDAILYKAITTGRFIIRGGTSGFADGASCYFYGKDHPTNPGVFDLYAHDGTDNKALRGKPDGTLTWGGKNVFTELNGIVVTKAWQNSDGTYWYRMWSDGWIEQGGSANNISNSGGGITFPKAYSSWCNVQLSKTRHSSGDGYITGLTQDGVTLTGFNFKVDYFGTQGSGNTQKIYWYACGF